MLSLGTLSLDLLLQAAMPVVRLAVLLLHSEVLVGILPPG